MQLNAICRWNVIHRSEIKNLFDIMILYCFVVVNKALNKAVKELQIVFRVKLIGRHWTEVEPASFYIWKQVEVRLNTGCRVMQAVHEINKTSKLQHLCMKVIISQCQISISGVFSYHQTYLKLFSLVQIIRNVK